MRFIIDFRCFFFYKGLVGIGISGKIGDWYDGVVG